MKQSRDGTYSIGETKSYYDYNEVSSKYDENHRSCSLSDMKVKKGENSKMSDVMEFVKEIIDFLQNMNSNNSSLFTSQESSTIMKYYEQIHFNTVSSHSSNLQSSKINKPEDYQISTALKSLIVNTLNDRCFETLEDRDIDIDRARNNSHLNTLQSQIENSLLDLSEKNGRTSDKIYLIEMEETLEHYKKSNTKLKEINQQLISNLDEVCTQFESFREMSNTKIRTLEFEIKDKEIKIKILEREKNVNNLGKNIESHQDSFIKKISDINRTKDESMSPVHQSGSKSKSRDLKIEQWWNSPDQKNDLTASASGMKNKVKSEHIGCENTHSSKKAFYEVNRFAEKLEYCQKTGTLEVNSSENSLYKNEKKLSSGSFNQLNLNKQNEIVYLSSHGNNKTKIQKPDKKPLTVSIKVKMMESNHIDIDHLPDDLLHILIGRPDEKVLGALYHMMKSASESACMDELRVSKQFGNLITSIRNSEVNERSFRDNNRFLEGFVCQTMIQKSGQVVSKGFAIVGGIDTDLLVSQNIENEGGYSIVERIINAQITTKSDNSIHDLTLYLNNFSQVELCFDLAQVPIEKRQTAKILTFAKRNKITPQLLG